MNLLTVEGLSKSYGEKILFDQISFSIAEKQRIGLIGVNGTGKSTLLKVLAGLDTAESGQVTHANRFRAEYLAQSPEFADGITVLDHIFAGDNDIMQAIRAYEEALAALDADNGEAAQKRLSAAQQRMDALSAWDAATQAKIVLTKLGITDFDKPVAQLSGGQRKRVALAAALIQPADLLILDEPTNHIDNDTVEWLEDTLSKYRGALLLVTHDRYFLDRVTNRIFELTRGKLYAYEGNYGVYLEKKADREEQEAASEDKRQNLLRRELAWLRRGAKARTTKQKARVDRAESLRDQQTAGAQEKLDLSVGASRLGKKVLELKEAAKAIEDRPLIHPFSYIVMPRDRVGIIGPNGAGKSTLLNMLAGLLEPDSGTIETGQTVKLAYYTQENAEMNPNLRVLEYVKEAAEVIRTVDGETITASQMLERFLFNGTLQWTPIAKLSGGEKRRLYLLRTLMMEPNVLLLDEPTNDLDIETLSILEDYLENFPGAVIAVSHDRYFLDRTAEHLFVFEGEGTITHFYGNYSEYLESKQTEKAAQSAETRPTGQAPSAQDQTDKAHKTSERPKKLSYKEQKEWETIESVIAELEERIERLKRELADNGSDSMKVQAIFEEEQRAAAELEKAMDRWAELSELVDEIAANSRTPGSMV